MKMRAPCIGAEKATDMKNNSAIDTSELDSRQFPTTVALRREINQIKGQHFPESIFRHRTFTVKFQSRPQPPFTLTPRRSAHNLMSIALGRDEMGHLHLRSKRWDKKCIAQTQWQTCRSHDECTKPVQSDRPSGTRGLA
jgi:hypothetical protein